MAVTNSKGTAATAHDAGSKLSTLQLAGRVRCSTDEETLTAQADAGSTIKLGWFPYGATILDGEITHSATATGVTLKGGIIGASGTSYDNDNDLFFAATAAATAAESRSAAKPLRVLATASGGPGYTVTDPDGAYVILTTAGGNAPSGSVFRMTAFWVMD